MSKKNKRKQTAISPTVLAASLVGAVVAGVGIWNYVAPNHTPSNPPSQTLPIYYTPEQPYLADSGASSDSGLERITLEQAQVDPSLRQTYLGQLIAGKKLPYCNSVVYDHDGSKLLEHTYQDLIRQGLDKETADKIIAVKKQQIGDGSYAAMTPHSHFTRGRGESSTIFIGRRVFEQGIHQIEDDVAATIDHETRHAVQAAEGLPLDYMLGDVKQAIFSGMVRMDTFENIGELDAYYHLLEKIKIKQGKYHVSTTYLKFVESKVIDYYNRLLERRKELILQLERKLIDVALALVKEMPVSYK